MVEGAKPSRQNSTGLMSRSFNSARIRTLSGWASTAAAVDRSRSARVAFKVLPIGFVRSLDSIRVKEHSDLKRGVHLSPVPIGISPRAYKGFRPSPGPADGSVIRIWTGEGGGHEALRHRRADSGRVGHQGE